MSCSGGRCRPVATDGGASRVPSPTVVRASRTNLGFDLGAATTIPPYPNFILGGAAAPHEQLLWPRGSCHRCVGPVEDLAHDPFEDGNQRTLPLDVVVAAVVGAKLEVVLVDQFVGQDVQRDVVRQ